MMLLLLLLISVAFVLCIAYVHTMAKRTTESLSNINGFAIRDIDSVCTQLYMLAHDHTR